MSGRVVGGFPLEADRFGLGWRDLGADFEHFGFGIRSYGLLLGYSDGCLLIWRFPKMWGLNIVPKIIGLLL